MALIFTCRSPPLEESDQCFCPKGFCVGSLKNLMCVCPFVRPSVRRHLFARNVQYCFKYPNRALKKSEKRGVPLDPVRKQILMWKKVDPKSDQFWLTSCWRQWYHILRLSYAKALRATLPCRCNLVYPSFRQKKDEVPPPNIGQFGRF